MTALPRFIRRKEVEALTGLSTSTLYDAIKAGTFPAPVPLTPGISGWLETDIRDWMETKLRGVGRTLEPEKELV